jgi:NTP pyrophosphatase (non-canonical NTP hydrolase)
MNFSAYQESAHRTAVYPSDVAALYTTLGLVGEAGEIANKVKKAIRDDGGQMSAARRAAVLDELGDVLWYAAELCTALNADLGEVAAANIAKLADRQARGALHGDGDKR